jgi:PmbA protein
MSIDIIKLLNAASVDGYRVNTVKTESYELFFVHERLETVRGTDTCNTQVTVYVDHDGKRGEASFKVYASTTEAEVIASIADAAGKAKKINNDFFTLPDALELSAEIPSNFTDYEPKALAKEMAKAVFSAETYGCGSVNALEVFINKTTSSVQNSNGRSVSETKYSAVVEVIPTWTDGESVELYQCERFSHFDVNDLRSKVEQKMREVRDRGVAQQPKEKLSCRVVLDAKELSHLFSDIVGELDYASVYSHMNSFSVGDSIQKERRGDAISVTMRGAIEGSSASALFDVDGTLMKDTEVIRNGEIVANYGSHRFAQYLGKEPTGQLGCAEVEVGTLTDDELASAPYFRCVSMSGIQLDILSDYIGGEVRLAYYVDGDKVIPMTGISISGELSEALNSVRFSNVKECAGRYLGPKLASFEGIEIV